MELVEIRGIGVVAGMGGGIARRELRGLREKRRAKKDVFISVDRAGSDVIPRRGGR